MKKIITTLFIAGGLATSFAAHAENIPANGLDLTTALCPVLGEQVRLNLSKDVHGSYDCSEAVNSVAIATCHKSGSRKPASVQCVLQEGEWNHPSCNDQTDEIEFTDYRGFTAVSTGGGVATKQLGGNCTDATVEAILPDLEA